MNRITNRICALVLMVAFLVAGVFMAPVSAFADGVEPIGGISSGSNPASAGTTWSAVNTPSAGTVWSPVNASPTYQTYSVKKPVSYSVKKPYVPTYYSYPSYSYSSWYGGSYGGPTISFNFNKNKNTNTNTNTNVVNVNTGGSNHNHDDDDDDDNDAEDPWCDIEADDTSVEEGDRVTLEWETDNAVEARINQGIGSVDEDGGEERVRVNRTTTFRMTVENKDGDTDTCSVTVRVDEEDDDVVLTSLPTDNPLTSVYLSQVPYTGFDLGPYAALYYVLFALVGAAAAYAVIFMIIPRMSRKVKALEAAARNELEEDGDE